METMGWRGSDIAESLNINLSEIDNVDAVIPLSQYVAFMENVAKVYKATYFGLYAARKTKLDALGPIEFLFSSAPTLQDALVGLTNYISVVQEGTKNQLILSGNEALFEYQILGNSIFPRRQDAEYSISVIYEYIKNYIRNDFMLNEVYFEHQKIGNYATYTEHFGCEVFFGQSNNMIIFDQSLLSISNPSISKKLYPILSAHLDIVAKKKPIIETTAGCINNMLNLDILSQGPNAQNIANKMGVSLSTLARRLKSEGTSYSEILRMRRLSEAKHLLKNTNIPISEIALQLGYSETASFSRAFKSSSNLTPEKYRQS